MQKSSGKYEAVVIVASLGGIPALATLLSSLPADFRLPILVVQHRSSGRPSHLAEILRRSTTLRVGPAEEGDSPQAGCVYLAPPNLHLLIDSSHRIALSDGRPIRHLLSAGDPLFSSAAAAYGPGLIAVVLTGTDSDGAKGVVDVKAAGGTVIAQDEATSEAFGMPKAAVATGCVDAVLPISQIGPRLVRMANA